ncbi:MAG: hypothetical protein ABI211_07635 [Vicinamibacterales bacterium]
MRLALLLVLCALLTVAPAEAQRRRTPAPTKPKPAPVAALKVEPAAVTCAELLGTGVKSHATFCFVLAGRDPAQGVLVTIPPHTGPATLTFSLHNRHTYSEEEMKAGHGFAKYTAVIAVLSMTGELLGRGAVQSEFRAARDLFDRVSGGAGPGGVKAVAPIGNEAVSLTIPANVEQVSLLGEVLESTPAAGRESTAPGRPVAIVSNVQVEYRPAPPARKR